MSCAFTLRSPLERIFPDWLSSRDVVLSLRPAAPAVTILPALFLTHQPEFQDYDLSESCHYYYLEGFNN